MNEDNRQNGLFSDDYEPPKRENPYLKKNREKARLQKSSELQPPKRTPPVGSEGGYTCRRTFSDWMFEHVKLIATIVTIIVVLSLVLITDVVGAVERAIAKSKQADKQEITLTYVEGLSELGQPITWNHLEEFRRDETKAKDSVTWMLPVKGTDYELWISGYSTDKAPVYVYLFDMRTGDRLVLGKEDLDAFVKQHS